MLDFVKELYEELLSKLEDAGSGGDPQLAVKKYHLDLVLNGKSLPGSGNKKPKEKNSILQQPAAKLEVGGQQLAALIPRAHHQAILDKVKTGKERLFYLRKTVEQGRY